MSHPTLCPICGGTYIKTTVTHEESNDKGQVFVFQNVPALVCEECGEYLMSDTVVEKLEAMTQTATPIKEVLTPVFDYAQS